MSNKLFAATVPYPGHSTGKRYWLHQWQLTIPLTFFFLLFFIAPLLIMLIISLHTSQMMDELGLDQYVRFFSDSLNLEIMWATIWLGIKTTLVCLFIGYPIALLFTWVSSKLQTLLVFLIILPLLTSSVVRTFAWVVILGREGIINNSLLSLGLIELPARLLYTEWGLVAALAQIWMPLMILPLITTIVNIDPAIHEASRALGAGAWRSFVRITLPLSMPGIVAGSLLVFAASSTAFVVQSVIGGGRNIYLPVYMYQQASGLQNWPFSAAIAIIFLTSILLIFYTFDWISRRVVILPGQRS